MSNVPSWMSKWARSPRQDRRVIEDGKFVELGKVHQPTAPPVEEQVEANTALEVVHEQVDEGASAEGNVSLDAPNGSSDSGHETSEQSNEPDRQTETGVAQSVSDASISTVDKEFKILPIPTIPAEAFEFIEEAQKANEAISGTPGNLLTEEQSDALAETLRLPESTEDDIPF